MFVSPKHIFLSDYSQVLPSIESSLRLYKLAAVPMALRNYYYTFHADNVL